uniref:Pentatricopeptide repeat-containing protein n=1 Tax=Chenopodium quinoa TaxID=63459 RepID=A0A803L424_CHEQI
MWSSIVSRSSFTRSFGRKLSSSTQTPPSQLNWKMVGFCDDTHDVSSSRELELNPNFDENNDAHMSGIGLNDQELVGEMVKESAWCRGGVNAEMLNQLISAFSKLGKGKAAYEAFGEFEEFGCVLNVDRYKSKEVHVVYLAAKKDKKYPSQKAVNFLISCLLKVDETVNLAQEMLVDFSDEVCKHAINPFSWVICGLCRKNDIEGAKKLFAEMMEKGPPPGNAILNIIINSLSKAGDMEDAKRLLKLMETRGLKLDALDWKSAEKLLEEMKEKGLYLPGIMRGLISAVKELEQEAVGSKDDHAKPKIVSGP